MRIVIICKAKNMLREINFRWHGIGEAWTLDESDSEIISKN